MSNKKVSMTNVLNLVDEFALFIEKTDQLLKTPFEDESLRHCIFIDVIKNAKRTREELWGKIKAGNRNPDYFKD